MLSLTNSFMQIHDFHSIKLVCCYIASFTYCLLHSKQYHLMLEDRKILTTLPDETFNAIIRPFSEVCSPATNLLLLFIDDFPAEHLKFLSLIAGRKTAGKWR